MAAVSRVAGTENERARRARLANLRDNLLSPAIALVGAGDLICETCRELEDPSIAARDVERIKLSSGALVLIVEALLDDDRLLSVIDSADRRGELDTLRHDIRTPLNAIKGYAELLHEDMEDFGETTMLPGLGFIIKTSQQLLEKIEDIVRYAETADDHRTMSDTVSNEYLATILENTETRASSPTPGHILVVDDVESNRDLLAMQLRRQGHTVDVAVNGADALEKLRSGNFDAALLDLLMPVKNGLETLLEIKADEALRDYSVIMISALDERDSLIRCIEAGAEDFLSKPINPVILGARLNAALEKSQWRKREREFRASLEMEKEKNEALLANILPPPIVGRLNAGEELIADRHDNATVLFTDFVGFTKISAAMEPSELVSYLNNVFSEFDGLCKRLGVEKIKTIGDAYMVVAGLPAPRPDHCEAAVEMALGMMSILEDINQELEIPFRMRVGIHTGPVVAGIIGKHRFVFDVWGDTVNMASRYESYSEPNRIHTSREVYDIVGENFDFESRGILNIRGCGEVETFFINGELKT